MTDERKALPELSVDTQVLIKRLSASTVGETITYEELSALIGRDVQNGARGFLATARRRLKRDERMVFAPVYKIGVKRLDDIGIVKAGQAGITHVRNHARRVTHTLLCLGNYDALPRGEQVAYNVTVAQAGMLAHITKTSTVKKIEQRVPTTEDAVPAKFLEAIRDTL